MKRLIFTFSFLALTSIALRAQNAQPTKIEPIQDPERAKKELKANDKPTAQPAATKPNEGTRMAITEKGVPAAKESKPASDKAPVKEVKQSPAQPAKVEKEHN